jgi:hypothetical protein
MAAVEKKVKVVRPFDVVRVPDFTGVSPSFGDGDAVGRDHRPGRASSVPETARGRRVRLVVETVGAEMRFLV